METSQNPKPIIAAAYMRVSTARQEDEETIEGQRVEIIERLEKDGLTISRDFLYEDDGWTGSLKSRPALDRMLNDARKKFFNRLYVYDRSRISRDFIAQEEILQVLRIYGVEVVELHGISGSQPHEIFSGRVMGAMAEYERDKIKERMSLGKRRIVKENKELLGYNPCYGYDLHRTVKGKDGHRAYFTVNEEQAKVVKMMFEWATEGKSMYYIRKMLKEEGILPPRSERGVWGNTTVARILRNTTYIGEHYYNKHIAIEAKNPRNQEKYRRLVKTSMKLKPKSEWWKIEVPAIIDKDLFNKAQKELDKRKRYNRRNNKYNFYLLNGLVHCECGRARTGDPAPNHHCYYRCVNRLEKLERTCMSPGVCVPILDEKVWNTVVRLLTQPTVIQKFIDKMSNNEEKYQQEIDRINDKLKKLDKENDRYIDIFGKGIIDEQKLRALSDDLRDRKINLEMKKLEYNQLIRSKPSINASKIAQNMVRLLEKELSFEEKQKIVRAVVEKVEAVPTEATIYGRIPIFEGIGNDLISIKENEEKVGLNAQDSNLVKINQHITEKNAESDDTKCEVQKNFTSGQVGLNVKDRHRRLAKCRQIHVI